MSAPRKIYLASTNQGKLHEYQVLAEGTEAEIALGLLPGIERMPAFEEIAPTFGENAVGKALHYSRLSDELVLADDSGLVVPSLGGAPGVKSARYAGEKASNAERIGKLLRELGGKKGQDRTAHFVCVIALARHGHAETVVSDRVDGCILESAYGESGFGYDPVFYFPHLNKTFAELSTEEKNKYSHRGKAFRRLLASLPGML
jgi:XTP/dITP diphosphohydrolase